MSNSVKPRISSALIVITKIVLLLVSQTQLRGCYTVEKNAWGVWLLKICHVLVSTQTGHFAYLALPDFPTTRGRLHPNTNIFIRELLLPDYQEKDEHTMFFPLSTLNIYLFSANDKSASTLYIIPFFFVKYKVDKNSRVSSLINNSFSLLKFVYEFIIVQ